jgi:ABC-2 type transport system ATP-binding protein
MTIEIRGLTKRYGPETVVDDLSFTVHPGQVTGFLGPNGAGKSTTMKMIVGLAAPTRGSVTIGGRRYRDLPVPLTEVGALLDAGAVHGGRKAHDHLLALAVSNGLPRRRVGEVLGRNGLDPEGIRWIRDFMRSLAREGRAVLVSSHLMSEMAQTADHLVVIGRGRLVADTTVSELVRGEGTVLVRTSEPGFARLLATAGAAVREGTEASLVVSGMTSAEIGKVAAYHGVALAELTPQRVSLEDAFMELTQDRTDYQGAVA